MRKGATTIGKEKEGESGVNNLGSEGCTLAPSLANVGCTNLADPGSEGRTLIPVASCQPHEQGDVGSVAGTAGSSLVDQEEGELC